MDWTREDYQRLGDQFRAARRELGYKTLKSFQDYLDGLEDKQLSGRTYADIEAGELRKRARFSAESLAFLEDLFGWAPGVHRSILDGRYVDVWSGIYLDTTPATGWRNQPDEPQAGGGHRKALADMDERVAALEDRVRQLELRLRPRRPIAQRPRPDVTFPMTPEFEAHLDGEIDYDDEADLPQALPLRRGMPGGAAPLADAARTTNEEPGLKKARREHDEAAERIEDDRAGMEPS